MLSLYGKATFLIISFFLATQFLYAQKCLKGFKGNIEITDTLMIKTINGFCNYLKEDYKTFNSSDYFIGITILHSVDSTDEIELTISNYAMTRPAVKKLPGYYGFLKRDGIYFIFWNENMFMNRNNKIPNPDVFGKYKVPRIIAPYDPYTWKLSFKNHEIINLFPRETVEKYIQ